VSEGNRVRALDGLRGLAALLVLVHHAVLTSATLAEPYRGGRASGWASWVTYTPAHLLWAGAEAVLVFFVLSGYVLTLPALAPDRPSWRSYYAQRLPRLYLPVWGSLVLAVVLAHVVSRSDVAGASWWLNRHNDVPRRAVAESAALVTEPSFSLNGPLWSLRWEVLFSVLLPVFVGLALATRRRRPGVAALAGITALLGLVACGALLDSRALMYLPVFGVGVLLAANRERGAALAERVSPPAYVVIAVGCAFLLTAYWCLLGLREGHSSRALLAVGLPLEVVGAALVMLLFAHWRPAVRLGEAPVTQWLGKRSFSLYLVHEPIVVATAFLLRGRGGTPLVAGLAIPAALLAAAAFYLAVERPSHQLARRIGTRLQQRVAT
jgi:peptidoglycan/LPS O-acetylase OafA/YrhL